MAGKGTGGAGRLGLRPGNLTEALEVLDVVFDTDPAGIFIYSQDGRLVDCNRAACAMHGFSKADMLGMAPKDFIHPDGYQTFVDFQRELETQGWFQGESCGITRDGAKFEVEVYGQPVMINGEGYLYSAIRDITQAKDYLRQILTYERELEERVERRTLQLARSNRKLEQFAYLTSHDLQEPLRTVTSCAELLQSEYADVLDEDGRQALQYVADGTRRMSRLIRDLLDHSRLGSEAAAEPVDCNALLDDVLVDLSQSILEAKATVQVGDLPTLNGLRTELQLLFQNLIANAIKFRRPDTAPLIQVRAEAVEGGWRFAVQDNGIGIEERHFETVFRVFRRLHRRGTYAGSGIGLAHCQKIVELHGGDISLESTLGEGTTFIFDIKEVEA